jgi:hypothetical protein
MKRVDVTIIGEVGIRKPAKELTFNKPESKIRQREYTWGFVINDIDTLAVFAFDLVWIKDSSASFIGELLKTCKAATWILETNIEYRENDSVWVVQRKEKLPVEVVSTDSSYIFKGRIKTDKDINSLIGNAITTYNIEGEVKFDACEFIGLGEIVSDSIGDTPDPALDITFFRFDIEK